MKVKKGNYKRKDADQKPHWMAKALQISLPILVLFAVVAIVLDIQNIGQKLVSGEATKAREELIASDIARLEAGLNGKRYKDPLGKFSIAPPVGWQVDESGNDGYYDVTFRGRNGMELNLLATPVRYSNFSKLRRKIEEKELNIGLNTHIEEKEFEGHPAIRRICELQEKKLYTIDFLANGMAHHLLFVAPRELYADYLPVMKDIMNTYILGKPPAEASGKGGSSTKEDQ